MNYLKKVRVIEERIENFKTDEKFDYVIHLAARPSPDDYTQHPVETALSNSLGTYNALEIARKSDAVFLYTSSSEVYDHAEVVPTILFYEPGLEELIAKNRERLYFTTKYEELSDVDLAFITVSTPTVDGRIYLGHVFSAAKSLSVIPKDSIIVIKSTVIPGTARKVKEISGREVVSNPEFLREGSAIQDTVKLDRIVIGSDSKEAGDLVERLWSFTGAPVVRTTLEEAEMIKYAANSFLALKVSFINEIANLCEKIPGCDATVVAKAIGMDKRISPYYLKFVWDGEGHASPRTPRPSCPSPRT